MTLNSQWINTLIIEGLIIFLFFQLLVCIYTCMFNSYHEKGKRIIKETNRKLFNID